MVLKTPVAGLVERSFDPGACPPPPEMQMNHTQEERAVEAVAAKEHWTYRALKHFAYFLTMLVFWLWVLFLALSGKF